MHHSGQSRPEHQERGMKRHKGGPTFWCTQCPIEGTRPPEASYLCLDQEASFTTLYVGCYLGAWVLRGLPEKEVQNHLVWI
jgi:hypothetical protein